MLTAKAQNYRKSAKRIIVCLLAISFLGQNCIYSAYGQLGPINLAPAHFNPAVLRYLSVNSSNPFNYFNFLLDKGDSRLAAAKLNTQAKQLINYFFLGITLPDNAFWVNLRPDEPGRITSEELSQTDMGKVLLEQDLQLKRDIARYLHPSNTKGKEFWEKLYAAIGKDKVKKAEITTSNRVWIMPDEAVVMETEDGAFVVEAKLKVMLETEYLGRGGLTDRTPSNEETILNISKQLMREIILPAITQDVNTSPTYAPLRQIYNSLILAQWFKRKHKNSNSVYSFCIDKGYLKGLESQLPWSKQAIWQEYLGSYQNGEYKLKEKLAGLNRMYWSGGMDFTFRGGDGSGGVGGSSPIKVIPANENPSLLEDLKLRESASNLLPVTQTNNAVLPETGQFPQGNSEVITTTNLEKETLMAEEPKGTPTSLAQGEQTTSSPLGKKNVSLSTTTLDSEAVEAKLIDKLKKEIRLLNIMSWFAASIVISKLIIAPYLNNVLPMSEAVSVRDMLHIPSQYARGKIIERKDIVVISFSPKFKSQIENALELFKKKSPDLYKIVSDNISTIIEGNAEQYRLRYGIRAGGWYDNDNEQKILAPVLIKLGVDPSNRYIAITPETAKRLSDDLEALIGVIWHEYVHRKQAADKSNYDSPMREIEATIFQYRIYYQLGGHDELHKNFVTEYMGENFKKKIQSFKNEQSKSQFLDDLKRILDSNSVILKDDDWKILRAIADPHFPALIGEGIFIKMIRGAIGENIKIEGSSQGDPYTIGSVRDTANSGNPAAAAAAAKEALRTVNPQMLKEKASQGDINAVYALSNLADYGNTAAQNVLKNLNPQVFVAKASQGDEYAVYALGYLAIHGNPAAQNVLKNLNPQVFVEKASQGDEDAVDAFGYLAREGNTVAKDALKNLNPPRSGALERQERARLAELRSIEREAEEGRRILLADLGYTSTASSSIQDAASSPAEKKESASSAVGDIERNVNGLLETRKKGFENSPYFDKNGIAKTEEFRRKTLYVYQKAINRFIEELDKIGKVVEGDKGVVLGIVGSLTRNTRDKAILGLFPQALSYEEAVELDRTKWHRWSEGEITHFQRSFSVPSDLDFIIADYKTSLEIKQKYISKKIYEELGVLINAKAEEEILPMPIKLEQASVEEWKRQGLIPVEEIKGDGLLKLYGIFPESADSPAQAPSASSAVDARNILDKLNSLEERNLEYGLHRGILSTDDEPLYKSLYALFTTNSFDGQTAERLSQTLAKMKAGSLEIMYITGVITEHQRDILFKKDTVSLQALSTQESQAFTQRLQLLVESYNQNLTKTQKAHLMKRLVPLGIIEALAQDYDTSNNTILLIMVAHPDFPIWIRKAKVKVNVIKDKVGGADNAWGIVRSQGLEKTDAWVKSAEEKVKAIKEKVGGSRNAWLIVRNQGLEKTDAWVKSAEEKVKAIKDKVGGADNAWGIVRSQGLEKTDAWVKSAEEKVKAIKDKVGGASNAWGIVISQGLERIDAWVKSAEEKVKAIKEKVGGADNAWGIVRSQGLEKTDAWVKSAEEKVKAIKEKVGGSRNAWLIVRNQGLEKTDAWVDDALRLVKEMIKQGYTESAAWREVIKNGMKISQTPSDFSYDTELEISSSPLVKDITKSVASPLVLEDSVKDIQKGGALPKTEGGIDLSNIELTLKDEKFVSSLNSADLKVLRAGKALKDGWESLSLLYVHEIMLLLKDNLIQDIQNREMLFGILEQLKIKDFLDPQGLQFLQFIQSQKPLSGITMTMAN